MKRKFLLHSIELICLIVAVFFVCYFLFQDDNLPISINSVWFSINHTCMRQFHILAVGLLPIYVALMVFGTAIFSKYCGSRLQRVISQLIQHKSSLS